MNKFIFIEEEVAAKTNWKAIKNAQAEGKFKVMYFPRDNVFHIEYNPDLDIRIITAIKNVVTEIYPDSKEA